MNQNKEESSVSSYEEEIVMQEPAYIHPQPTSPQIHYIQPPHQHRKSHSRKELHRQRQAQRNANFIRGISIVRLLIILLSLGSIVTLAITWQYSRISDWSSTGYAIQLVASILLVVVNIGLMVIPNVSISIVADLLSLIMTAVGTVMLYTRSKLCFYDTYERYMFEMQLMYQWNWYEMREVSNFFCSGSMTSMGCGVGCGILILGLVFANCVRARNNN